MKLFIVLVASLFIFSNLIHCASEEEEKKADENNFGRYLRVINAMRIILFGQQEGDDLDDEARDMYIDTKTGALASLGKADDGFTIDDLLRIFAQSIVVIVTQKRYDLLPKDFLERHKEFDFVVKNLNSIFDDLKTKGTEYVTLGRLRKFIKTISTDAFWNSFDDMYNEVKQRRIEEAELLEEKKLEEALEKQAKAESEAVVEDIKVEL